MHKHLFLFYIYIKRGLTKVELNDLLNILSSLKPITKYYYITALLASNCGLRIGEICGLKWTDIDFKKNTIKIERQLKQDKDKKWVLGTLKSSNSYRTVPLLALVKNELLNYQEIMPLDINGLIINKSVDTVANNIGKLFKKNGYSISIHELRHTYATLLIANGIDFKTAAKLLGHDVKETIKTYSHVNDEMLNNARTIIEKIF